MVNNRNNSTIAISPKKGVHILVYVTIITYFIIWDLSFLDVDF